MKKFSLIVLALATLGFVSCSDDDSPVVVDGGGNGGNGSGNNASVTVTGKITSNTTWTSDKIYQLNQKVVVDNGVTLTIEPGTIIKGSPGVGSLASALIVARGGKLMAEGTASEPIIFTSTSDNISVGQTEGTNLSENDRGLWGGLIVLGNAPCSFSGDVAELQIEGIPADDTFGLYGGNSASDNSGVIKYVSIRHGGALIGEGNEINGLTLGGVGSGTVIDHVEVVANVDDGIEFFGGTVNASNLLVWGQGDDALDIDQAYSGTIDNAVIILGDASDHAFEIDGPEGSATGSFTLQNTTIIGNAVTTGGEYADYRKAATGSTSNIFAYDFPSGKDVELDNNGVAQKYIDGDLTFSNWEVVLANGVTIGDIFLEKNADGESDISTFETDSSSFASGVTMGNETVGANSANLNWTYAKSKSAF